MSFRACFIKWFSTNFTKSLKKKGELCTFLALREGNWIPLHILVWSMPHKFLLLLVQRSCLAHWLVLYTIGGHCTKVSYIYGTLPKHKLYAILTASHQWNKMHDDGGNISGCVPDILWSSNVRGTRYFWYNWSMTCLSGSLSVVHILAGICSKLWISLPTDRKNGSLFWKPSPLLNCSTPACAFDTTNLK